MATKLGLVYVGSVVVNSVFIIFSRGDAFFSVPFSLLVLSIVYFFFRGWGRIFFLSFVPILSSLLAWPFLQQRIFNGILVISVFEMIFLSLVWFQILDLFDRKVWKSGEE